ncbi:twin-arginine translocation signal domain-containing protein, partial [Roseibium sp.]
MDRRSFIKKAGLGAGGAVAASTLAAPAIAQSTTDMVIVSTWPRDFPGLGIPAQRLAARIAELTEGRINVQYFAAGERVGAFDSFDEVASGNAQAY